MTKHMLPPTHIILEERQNIPNLIIQILAEYLTALFIIPGIVLVLGLIGMGLCSLPQQPSQNRIEAVRKEVYAHRDQWAREDAKRAEQHH